jgi:hypothetical protein
VGEFDWSKEWRANEQGRRIAQKNTAILPNSSLTNSDMRLGVVGQLLETVINALALRIHEFHDFVTPNPKPQDHSTVTLCPQPKNHRP